MLIVKHSLVRIDADWVTSCVRNWPYCMNNKLIVGCGRSVSRKRLREMVRAFGSGDPVTDKCLEKEHAVHASDNCVLGHRTVVRLLYIPGLPYAIMIRRG